MTLTSAGTYGGLLGEGTITFQPGQTKYAFDYNVVDDSLIEGTEQVVLTLSNPVNAAIGTASSTIDVI